MTTQTIPLSLLSFPLFSILGLGVGGEYQLTMSGAAAYHVKTMEEALVDDEDQYSHHGCIT
jgi:hypothetical protein